MDGFDANYILEEFMGTKSLNPKTEALIDEIYEHIQNGHYEQAEQQTRILEKMTNSCHPDVIRADMLIKRERLL